MSCYDCKRPYGDEHGFPDLIISNELWQRISPTGDDGGLLCPSCICKRLYDAGVRQAYGSFMSGPVWAVERPVMESLRWTENLRRDLERLTRRLGLALVLLALGATAAHAQVAESLTKEVMYHEANDSRSVAEAMTGEVAEDDDAASPAPHISTGGIPDGNRISAPADEVSAEADEPSPWIMATWLPVRPHGPVEGEESMGLDVGVGAALHSFKGRWWRLIPAAVGIGRETVALGPGWVISKRGARRPVALVGGIAAPYTVEHGIDWSGREYVVGVAGTMGGGE